MTAQTPAPLPARPPLPVRPTTIGVEVHREQTLHLTVAQPQRVLAAARRAAREEPCTASLLGIRPGPGALPLAAAAALLAALHDADDLAALGLDVTTTIRVTATGPGHPISLELTDDTGHADDEVSNPGAGDVR
ncbi:hypothetical protein ACFWNK_38180 [Streptomyces sp. NPDC058417]|uniref:hypothetical protein n=1 Tax=unclassified Streptomyces TaxID=2593676 RepID=UPI003651F59E